MVRPRRLYKDSKGRYFYIVNNQQKFVKVPKDMAEKDVVKISLKTLENLINKRRVKRKKKRPDYKFEKPVVKGAPTAAGPSKLVVEGRKIPQIEDVVKNTKQKKSEQLAENVETFFDTLANKKTGLLSGTKMINQEEEKEQDAVALRSLPTKLRQVAKDIIASAKDYKDVIKIIDEEKFLQDPTKATGGFVTLAADQEKYKLTQEEKDQIYSVLTRTNIIGNNLLYSYSKLTGNEYFKSEKKGVKQTREADKSPPPTSEKKPPVESKSEKEPTAPAPPAEPKPPAKPASEQIRNIKKAIRKPRDTSGLMPSLRTPAKTTEEKLAETPSFSATAPSGTEAPAAPVSTSPMAESLAEQVRRELAIEEKTKSLMGLGEEGDDALYNDEIAKIIKKRVGKVVPVIPSDKVKYLKDYVKKGDKTFAAVINTADSNSDGTGLNGNSLGHWTSVFIDNRDDYPSVEYFDALVSSPKKELVVELKKIAKKMNSERMFLYKENRLQRQAKEASTCGWHAAQFIDDRLNGIPFSEATGYDDFINRIGKVDDSADGEKDIRKYIKKYKVYI